VFIMIIILYIYIYIYIYIYLFIQYSKSSSLIFVGKTGRTRGRNSKLVTMEYLNCEIFYECANSIMYLRAIFEFAI